MLQVEDLHVSYGGIAALRGVTLEVGAGEIVILLGPNGAGKTTTLSSIVGLTSPTQGTVRFGGEPLHRQVPERIVRRGITLVPEGRHIFGTLTVAENLRLGATTRRDGEVAADLERILARFPVLERYAGTIAGKLSGGEQQQLAIARALMLRPKLLLLDEPSLGLAPLVVEDVFRLLQDLRNEGVTILLVEQNARRTLAFADRAYVLRSGKIALSGAGPSLPAIDAVEQAYLGA
ncbi:MAG: ABC transporter ATP-binding protein [Solirubrobacteraceae bacterium]